MKSKLLNGFLLLVIILMFFAFWYKNEYSMKPIASYEVNNPKLRTKVLIASQGSLYKDELTKHIVELLAPNNIYILVMDIRHLPTINSEDFDAIIGIHTWEINKPPSELSNFIDRLKDKDKLFLVCTSGGGDSGILGIDGISSASIITDVHKQTRDVDFWLRERLR